MTADNLEALAAALQPLIHRVRADVTAVKREGGRQAWTREPLTLDRIAKHLNGGPARGVSQISAGSSSTLVGVLDFDSHGGETPWPAMLAAASDVMQSITLLGGSPISFRSSGGRGIHVYCLWDEPQDAYNVRQWLADALRSCGYKAGTRGVAAGEVEVFPKQNEVPPDGFGNQVVLPLAGDSVPILWEELAGDWVLGARSDVVGMPWPMSDSVPLCERPVAAARRPADVTGYEELATLLAAIPNSGKVELGYDQWRDVVFILHHETGGSEDGLALAHEFSARSGKYDGAFLDERVWPFIRSEGRDNVKGIGSLKRIASGFGWTEPLTDAAFEDISEQDSRPPTAAVQWSDATAVESKQTTVLPGAPDVPRKRVCRRGIPEAHYLTTDQANAQRLKNAFGSMVIVVADRWYVWGGKHWVSDESDVYRYACRLSELIREEVRPYRQRADEAKARGDTAKEEQMNAIADALGKWATRSEMKATIEAAVGLARKMLTVESGELDRDPWALNCENGTVDMRTGVLRKHNPEDYITRLVPVAYRGDATCPTWDRALLEIVGGDVGLRDFLQRWAGYCATGSVREQKFVALWGAGANGKSTFVETISAVLGDYSGTAAPGLLIATKGDRHPTEIAGLFGRRMVTAHESGENVVLREDFIKQATGGDRITARYMREDFFEFDPTHKIQLLTNHKPQVRGTDEGIWRRVMLVPFVKSFGSAEQVARGERDMVGDVELGARLRGELEGVLAWVVRGCLAWLAVGLDAPEVVRAASESYRSEQDRVGQFVSECCEVGIGLREPLTEGMGGLYPAYQSWCREGGVFPLSKSKFADEILRVLVRLGGAGKVVDQYLTISGGGRRKVKSVHGLRLLPE